MKQSKSAYAFHLKESSYEKRSSKRKQFIYRRMVEVMFYDDSLIIGRVSKKIRKRTQENMEVYNMCLSDSFEEAVRELAKEGTELWKAWYYSDFRKFIPSVYCQEYLDFSKYPLKYANK